MSFGVRRISKRVARTSTRSDDILSEEAWLDFDIGEVHQVLNEPLVLSSSSDDEELEQEQEQEDPVRRIERWMSNHAVGRIQTPDIVSIDEGYDQDELSSRNGSMCFQVRPYLSETLSQLSETQLRLVRELVVEMLPLLPESMPGSLPRSVVSSALRRRLLHPMSSPGGAQRRYRLPSVLV